MKKNDKISEALYTKLKSPGAHPAMLFGLAKVHKEGLPFRPVFSLPGSSYDHLNKTWAKYFDKIKGANIETNTQMESKRKLDESIISLDVKSLYTKSPLKEIAPRRFYGQINPPEISRKTMKNN